MKTNKIISLSLTGALLLSSASISNLTNFNKVANATETTSENKILDVKNLPNGEYTLDFKILNYSDNSQNSMSDGAVEKPAKLVVKDGEYKIEINFKPLSNGNFRGYLGNLKYYKNGQKVQAEIKEFYSENEKDEFFDVYKKEFPDRTKYPKVISFPISKEDISENKELKTKINVFVPVMHSFNVGYQDAAPVFDFNTLKVVSLENEGGVSNNETYPQYVTLDVTDESLKNTEVRRAVDKNAKIIEKDGKKYLLVTYYNKQNWGLDYKYDNGLMKVAYNYDGSDTITDLTPRLVENGEHYQISEVEIPISEGQPIYLFAEVQLNAYTGTTKLTHGIINYNKGKEIVKPETLQAPNLLRVTQLGSFIKESSKPRLPFDFEKNGELYSPYTAENGTKFKLADGRYEVDMSFARDSIYSTDVRYLKYTLDGTEPTMESNSAVLRSQSADESLSTTLYRILVNPMEDINGFSKEGGDVVVKVKAFNLDGTKSSETVTYTLPFSKHFIDSVNVNVDLNDVTYSGVLSSSGKYALTEEVSLKVEEVDERVKEIISEKIKQLGIQDAIIKNISVVDNKNNEYTLGYVNGWKEDINPLLKLEINNYKANDNSLVYIYEDEELKLVPSTYSNYSKKYSFSINKPQGYYVLATGNAKEILTEKIEKLKEKSEEAKKQIENLPSTVEKLKIEDELEKIEKSLSPRRVKYLRLDKVITHLENLEIYKEKLFSAKEDIAKLKEKVQEYIKIINSDIYTKIIKENKLIKLKKLANELNSNIENVDKLKEILPKVEEEFANLEYKYEVKDVEYEIENFDRPGVPSMANPVFEGDENSTVKLGKAILAPDKTYLLLNLKTMTISRIRAHLTDLDVLKENTEEEYPVHTMLKYEDLTSGGKIKLYDKALVVELDKEVNSSYVVKLGNDGMGGAKPKARLVIKTKVERTQPKEKEETGSSEVGKIEDNNNNENPTINKITKEVNNNTVTVEIKDENKKYDLVVNDVTTEEEEVLKEKIEDKNVELLVLDLNLVDKTNNEVVDLNQERTVKVVITKNLENKKVEVYYINEKTGELELIPSKLEGNKVIFKTNHFSKYAISITDKKEKDTTTLGTNNGGNEDNSASSDNSDNDTSVENNQKNKKSLPNTGINTKNGLILSTILLISAFVLRRKQQ